MSSRRWLKRAGVLAAGALLGVPGCWFKGGPAPGAPTGRAASAHGKDWMDSASPAFHGRVVKEAGYDFTKAKWTGVACSACHAASGSSEASARAGAPSCTSCHAGGPSGSPGHPAGWLDPTSPDFHGAVVKAAGNDYRQARAGNMVCSACHAGDGPDQASPVSSAANCYSCHAGGPDGSPGHPLGFMDPASEFFHGKVVREAGYDYTRALSGSLPCSACHAGESPGQMSPNPRAPSCFPCHAGGPTGSAGHPVGWGSIIGGTPVYVSRIRTCASCHAGAPATDPGGLSVGITLREDPGDGSSPAPTHSPTPAPAP